MDASLCYTFSGGDEESAGVAVIERGASNAPRYRSPCTEEIPPDTGARADGGGRAGSPLRQRCNRAACAQTEAKLSEALRANREWDKRYNELHRETLRYTQELERRLRFGSELDEIDLEKRRARGDIVDLQAHLQRMQQERDEAREASEQMRRRVEVLSNELRLTREQLARVKSSSGSREEIELMREQLALYQQDCRAERDEKERIKREREALQLDLVRARQQATTSEQNFKAARREKDELMHRLRTLAGEGPVGGDVYRQRYFHHQPPSWEAGCEVNGYGYDEPG